MSDRLAAYLAVLHEDGHDVGDGRGAGEARLATGQFHNVVLAGEAAFRFPRDEHSRRELPARQALLVALAGCELPVTIPTPLPGGHLDRPIGRCYCVLSRVPGEPAVPPGVLGARAVDPLVSRLAGLLGKLAEAGRDSAVAGAVPRTAEDAWLEWSQRVREVLFPLMSAAGRARAQSELDAVCQVPATGTALVHTDLGGANLLMTSADGELAVTGVLDWDAACIGYQAADLASLAVTFGWPVAQRIDARSQQRAGPMIPAARVIAATFALQQALPAALSGDAEGLADGLSEYV